MIRAGTVTWFAQHETRLAWRDWAGLLSGGRRRRSYVVVLALLGFVVFMHGLAYLSLATPIPCRSMTSPCAPYTARVGGCSRSAPARCSAKCR